MLFIGHEDVRGEIHGFGNLRLILMAARLMSDYEVTLVNDNSTYETVGAVQIGRDTDCFSQCA